MCVHFFILKNNHYSRSIYINYIIIYYIHFFLFFVTTLVRILGYPGVLFYNLAAILTPRLNVAKAPETISPIILDAGSMA